MQERFLTAFPQTETFVQGVIRLKGGNATYHLTQILALTDQYPIASVQAAVQQALTYGAFTARTVRHICESDGALALIPPQPSVQVSQPAAVWHDLVEQRPLAQYALLAEEGAQ